MEEVGRRTGGGSCCSGEEGGIYVGDEFVFL